MSTDIEHKRVEVSARIAALQRAILDSANFTIISTDREGIIQTFNATAERRLGYLADEVIGKATPLLFHKASEIAQRAQELSEELDRPITEIEALFIKPQMNDLEERSWTYRRKDSQCFPALVSVTTLRDANGETIGYLAIGTDLTTHKLIEEKVWQEEQLRHIQAINAELEFQKAELKAANARLELQATTDSLTGLKNYRAFQERLIDEFLRSVRYKKPLSLMILDLDHFKQFNDKFGHSTGNHILKRVAALLQSTARETDFVARFGGEEFAILLPDTELHGALEAAERMRAAIAATEWQECPVTISIGVASPDQVNNSPEALIDAADKALYLSKAAGRNQVRHFGAKMEDYWT